jgi:hypothetical protein
MILKPNGVFCILILGIQSKLTCKFNSVTFSDYLKCVNYMPIELYELVFPVLEFLQGKWFKIPEKHLK